MTIKALVVPEDKRLTFLPKLFSEQLMMLGEGMLFAYAKHLAPNDYKGGVWNFYTLSNGGGYAAPTTPDKLNISISTNGYEGSMSADAAGIVFTLYALNTLCFKAHEHGRDELTDYVTERYHQLRDFALDHAEARAIFRAID